MIILRHFSRITLKEVKAFLPKINCKISTSKLRDIFQEVDANKRGEISFDDFSTLYHKLIFDENVSVSVIGSSIHTTNLRFDIRKINSTKFDYHKIAWLQ